MITGLLALVAALFTLIVKTVDVQAIGPEESSVGLATVNQFMFNLFGVNLLWYDITDWMGLVAILIAFCFAIVGAAQFIIRKSIKRVDKSMIVLGLFYIVVVVCYILFEARIINYRPILMDGSLEASYPSSHTMIIYCIMAAAMIEFHTLIKNKTASIIFDTASATIIAVTVIGRLISGVHWFTDIVGDLLIGSALIMLFYTIVQIIQLKQRS